MATKTMILRPVASTISSGSNITFNPPGTTAENAYLLVNEYEADDDATYVIIEGALSILELYFDLPNERNILRATGQCRARSTGTIRAIYTEARVLPPENSALDDVQVFSSASAPGTGDWEYYEMPIESTESMDTINNPEYTRMMFRISCGTSSSSGSKSTTVLSDITQVYLELTYEEPETTTTPLYLRENGTWNAVSGAIYRKENSTWVGADDTVFTQGDQFALNVIN